MNVLEKQLEFIIEIDKLKGVVRRNFIADASRNENAAEHSWHIVMMAIVLEPYAADADILKVIKMLAIHDIVEIDAGDVYIHDKEAMKGKYEREQKAAARIYSIHPQGQQLLSLWLEFEECTTKEAKFAHMIDRLHPFLLHVASEGKIWKQNNITEQQVLDVMADLKEFPMMWEYLQKATKKSQRPKMALFLVIVTYPKELAAQKR